ncbi:hypothetical protein THTE_0713 [Thermogutta terrifontis]|uniref:Uncharacterized protein n=1 Tax=Thermogutta terrifontis TaxID=1331910 RepID=A0A286RBI4_9BACT|nr:hypothetical protein THTE_0713 [Thermogutta terrifontis]
MKSNRSGRKAGISPRHLPVLTAKAVPVEREWSEIKNQKFGQETSDRRTGLCRSANENAN